MRKPMVMGLLCWLSLGSLAERSRAQEEATAPGPINWELPTLGGKQFWADTLIFRDYRIQRHVFTGHYRLLDPRNHRLAWGSWEHCHEELEILKTDRQLPPVEGKVVIVLHGLFSNRAWMESMVDYLREEGGYEVVSVGYPTTRGTVGEHARSLASVIEHLDAGVDEINFVCHSLGNVVVRHYLADHTDPLQGLKPDPRIRRFVMLAPPNLGAELAEKLVPLDLSRKIVGKAACQLADWSELEDELVTPECEFGILAGGRGNDRGLNPLLTGDDDFMVDVASTKLPGACDFRLLPAAHATFARNPTVQQFALHFLRHGCFESEKTRQPIAR